MVTDQQVRRLFDVQNKHKHQYQAADAAGISSKTAHKYLKSGKLPSQCKVEHTWPTRKDPFADELGFYRPAHGRYPGNIAGQHDPGLSSVGISG